jgi:hypothetical protein
MPAMMIKNKRQLILLNITGETDTFLGRLVTKVTDVLLEVIGITSRCYNKTETIRLHHLRLYTKITIC